MRASAIVPGPAWTASGQAKKMCGAQALCFLNNLSRVLGTIVETWQPKACPSCAGHWATANHALFKGKILHKVLGGCALDRCALRWRALLIVQRGAAGAAGAWSSRQWRNKQAGSRTSDRQSACLLPGSAAISSGMDCL